MWHNNLLVLQTFASNNAQNCWGNLSTLGWKKVKPNAPDGVSNVFVLLNQARACGRPVNVFIDANEITIAYLL